MNDTPQANIHGTVLNASPPDDTVSCHSLDLTDADAVREIIAEVQPDQIYHLAAQAFVPRSFENPWETLENNIRAQLNVIQACIDSGNQPRTLVVSSAEIYGAMQPHEIPVDEDTPLRPANPYSVSKVTQDMMALQYTLSHNLPMMRARPFNHFGPGQNERFVASNFAMQIAKIEAGLQKPVMQVGNLSAQRDFTDVRDIVRAYTLIMAKGEPGEAYNIASGTAYSIQHLLDTLRQLTDVEIDVRVATDRLRPVDVPVVRGDYSRLHAATGWQPKIKFEQSLLDILQDCRHRLAQNNR